VVKSESADFFYKCDEFYNPSDEKAVQWNDPSLGVDWGVDKPILSARDSEGLSLDQISKIVGN
jgi:dTDP-4-dehydrorhamnose 3,5-epimerase